ncbi:MAG TPA: hypothetical protein VK447_03125 [Myxococcaceae bacterium]|nr:hypothetical protein [Myxococcaceae bacterium]
MNKYVVAEALEEVLSGTRRAPTTVMWNRLEGRPRRPDFSRALMAEVRDPLWLLTRQWQLGEFLGEDAGSPVSAKVAWRSDPITRVRGPGGGDGPYDPKVPLEAVVEAQPVPLTRAGRPHNVDLRLALGRRWKKLLEGAGLGTRAADFQTRYGFTAPDPSAEADFPVTAHADAWQPLAAVAGRSIDGGALVLHLSNPGALASDGLGLVDPEKSTIDALGETFLRWYRSLYLQPDETLKCWNPRQLEHSVGLAAPGGGEAKAVAAREYRGGQLDWYDFDAVAPARSDAPGTPVETTIRSFLPTTVQFDGMPNTRHWAFEEGATNFGEISPDTPDLSKLLLIEFGLIFANDWFLLPIELPVGSLTEIRGLAVTNVFGERYWIEPGVTGGASAWRMFRLTDRGGRDGRLLLPPTTVATLESAPVEAVSLVRDEVSNMVWGVETTVQLADGTSRRGREVALELHARHQAAVTPVPRTPPANDAKIAYNLMTSVPEHWIPMVPVRVPGDNREIQLQRAAMPRLLEGTAGITPRKVRPRTQLLREGLDATTPVPYFVAEEEVERAGTVVETTWQRCRWMDGRVVTWLGHHRTVGRGEASSGLGFDTAVPKKVP